MQQVSSSLYCLFQYDGSRTNGQRSTSSKLAISTVTHDLSQGERGAEDSARKRKREKKNKPTGVVMMGRRVQGQARRTLDFPTTSDEGERKGKEIAVPSDSEEEEEEEDYCEQ